MDLAPACGRSAAGAGPRQDLLPQRQEMVRAAAVAVSQRTRRTAAFLTGPGLEPFAAVSGNSIRWFLVKFTPPATVRSGFIARRSIFAMISALVYARHNGARERGGHKLFPGRRLDVALRAAVSLVAGAFFVSLCGGMDSPAHAAPSACDDAAELAFLPSPIAPWKGAPLRVLFAAEKPLEGK